MGATERLTDNGLSEGWASGFMGEVADVVGGGTPKTSDPANFSDNGHAWITPADLSDYRDVYIQRGQRGLSDRGLRGSSARLVPKGTVLMSSRAPIGYLAIAANDICTNQGFKSFICRDGLMPEYVYYWLKSIVEQIEAMGSGSTFTEISGSRCREIPIRVAPLAEQKRIVAMVERLLERVNAARDRLSSVPAILRRFRQSVLAAACSGRLTADWRATHPDTEPASQLISRVRDDVEREYRAACRRAKDEGRRKPTPPVMLKPSPLGAVDLPDVPETWTWTALSGVSQDITVGHVGPMSNEYVPKGVPFLRSLNVREFRFDPRDLKYISAEFHRKLRKSALGPGDVVIVRSGNAGVACVIPEELAEANCADLVIVRPSPALEADYACIVVNSAETRAHVDNVKVGIAQGHFNIGSARETPAPLPPLEEQHEIVRRVEALFGLADAIEGRVIAGRQRADRLTQSILAKAFRGELVPTEAELARREGRDLPAPRPGVWFVYAIRCDDGSLYIGQTQDLRKRWEEHLAGRAAAWTRQHRPVHVAHYEQVESRTKAVDREQWLKTGFGRKWLKREIDAGRSRQAGYVPASALLERIRAERDKRAVNSEPKRTAQARKQGT